MSIVVFFIVLFVLLLSYVPIAFAISLASMFFILMHNQPMIITVQRTFSGVDSFVLLALPLFVLTGMVMNQAGISERLIKFASSIVGHVRGGLALVNIVVSMLFAGVSGSAVADTAAVGSVIIPAMKKRGYPSDYAAAVTAASSTIGVIIPPSIPMVLYGVAAGASIGTLFIAGIIPGILVGVAQMVIAYYGALKNGYPIERSFSLFYFLQTFIQAVPALILPIIIIGGITFGVFTPTEAGGAAAIYSLLLAAVYRQLTLAKFKKIFEDTIVFTSIVMIIIGTSDLLGWVLSRQRVPQIMANAFMGISDIPGVAMMMISLMLIIMGTFLHGAPLVIVVVPMLIPLVNALGIDLIHFGMITVLCVGIGQQTPPVGSALFVTSAISGDDILSITFKNLPFIGAIAFVLLLVIWFPQLALWIPGLLK